MKAVASKACSPPTPDVPVRKLKAKGKSVVKLKTYDREVHNLFWILRMTQNVPVEVPSRATKEGSGQRCVDFVDSAFR